MSNEEDGQTKCNWERYEECRHPDWFDFGELPPQEHLKDLKESCKLCLFGEIARQLRLFSARQS